MGRIQHLGGDHSEAPNYFCTGWNSEHANIEHCSMFNMANTKLLARDTEMTASTNKSVKSMGTAEAFYRVFCALPISARLAVARYIIEDEEIQHLLENPNETTLEAFAENKSSMPVFHTVDELRKDLLM
jgi:hypothetical protein